MRPDALFLDRFRPYDIDDEPCDAAAQVEATIEPVSDGGQVVLAVLAVPQRVERAGQRGLQIAQHGFDPIELGQVARLEITHHCGQMDAARVGHRCKAPQAVAAHQGARQQSGLGRLANGLGREATDQVELEVQRMPLVVERDSGHERHLVLGAAPGLATSALAAEVGAVQLHSATQATGAVLLGHGAVDSLVQQPRLGVTHAQLAFERQRRQPGLGLADDVDHPEPGCKHQRRVLHQVAGRQRSLVPAPIALEQLARAVTDDLALGHRVALTASAHCDSAPTLRTTSGIDIPGWNWMSWLAMVRAPLQKHTSVTALAQKVSRLRLVFNQVFSCHAKDYSNHPSSNRLPRYSDCGEAVSTRKTPA